MRKPGHIAVSSLYMPVLAEPLFPASPMVLPISSSVEPVVILNQKKSFVAQAVDGGVASLAIAGSTYLCHAWLESSSAVGGTRSRAVLRRGGDRDGPQQEQH